MSPSSGQPIGQAIRVIVQTDGLPTVREVEVYRNNLLLGRETVPPYEVVWNTSGESDGTYVLTAKARARTDQVWVSPGVTVLVDNTPPRVAITSPRTGTPVDETARVDVAADDRNGIAQVSLLVDGQTALTVSRAPYTLNWVTIHTPNGSHTLQARAVDLAGNSKNSDPILVNVLNKNSRPVLGSLENRTVKEGQLLSIVLNARDPDGDRDPLTFHVTNLPSWMTLDQATHTISGTPGHSIASFEKPSMVLSGIKVEVCDPQPLCDAKELSITVQDSNSPPVLEPIGDLLAPEGERLDIGLIIHDPDGDVTTCKAFGLPPWLTFDATHCVASGTPGSDVATLDDPKKTYPNVRFEVCDPQPLCTSQTLTITVTDPGNRPPVFRPLKDRSIDEDSTLTFPVKAEDPDGGEPPMLSVYGLPEGANWTVKGPSGTFTWTPRADQSGKYKIDFVATDGIDELLITHAAVTITVRETSLAISGYVVDAIGQPVEGITVHLATPLEEVKQASVNSQGYYLFGGLSSGIYFVKPSYEEPETFDPRARSQRNIYFNPTHQRAIVKTSDHRDVSFVASPKS